MRIPRLDVGFPLLTLAFLFMVGGSLVLGNWGLLALVLLLWVLVRGQWRIDRVPGCLGPKPIYYLRPFGSTEASRLWRDDVSPVLDCFGRQWLSATRGPLKPSGLAMFVNGILLRRLSTEGNVELSHQAWREELASLVPQLHAAVMDGRRVTPHLRWELELLNRRMEAKRVILLVPPAGQPELSRSGEVTLVRLDSPTLRHDLAAALSRAMGPASWIKQAALKEFLSKGRVTRSYKALIFASVWWGWLEEGLVDIWQRGPLAGPPPKEALESEQRRRDTS